MAAQSTRISPKRLSVRITSNCLGARTKLHGAVVGVHVGQLDIWIIRVVYFLYNFAPQNAGFHHVGFFHRANFVATAAGQFKCGTCNAVDFGFSVALGVDAYAFVAFLWMPRGSPK